MSEPHDAQVFIRSQVFDTESYRSEEDLENLPSQVTDALKSALQLQAFYQKQRTNTFLVKELWDILRQMHGQKVFVVDLDQNGKSQIVGASILWEYDFPVLTNGLPRIVRFLEVGTQRVILNGFNIQQLLNSI